MFCNKRKKPNITNEIFLINGSPIERVSYTKFLGVFISENLNWCDHVSVLISKVSKNLGVARRIARVMPDHVLYLLYLTLIELYLSYCNIVWVTKETIQIKNIVIPQSRQFVIITRSRWNSRTSLLFCNNSNIKLNDLNTLLVGCFMHSTMHTGLPVVFGDFFY